MYENKHGNAECNSTLSCSSAYGRHEKSPKALQFMVAAITFLGCYRAALACRCSPVAPQQLAKHNTLSSSFPPMPFNSHLLRSLQTRNNKTSSITLHTDNNLESDVLADKKNIGSPTASDF